MAFIQCNFFSDVLAQATTINVLLPEFIEGCTSMDSHPIDRDFPVLYLLHGYNGDESVWHRYTALERYVGKYPLAVVMPRGNHGRYTDSPETGYRYHTFITEELPQKVKHFFNVSHRREDTFIAGLSMGAYGTLRAALGRPDLYAAAAALSGGLNVEKTYAGNAFRPHLLAAMGKDLNEARARENDLVDLLKKRVASGVPLPKLFVACGTEDSLYEHNVEFRDLCMKIGVDLTYDEEPGVHDWIYWDKAIQKVLAWLPIGEE
jgi:S-formylglutathione hydrolase FrmB